MTTIGLTNYEMSAKNATLTINSVLMAAAKVWTIKGGFGVHREPVCGTDFKRIIHGAFEADFESESIYVSDDNWGALGFPSTRDTVITVVSVDKDTNSPQNSKTIGITMKVFQFERTGPPNADGIVKAHLKGAVIGLPTGV